MENIYKILSIEFLVSSKKKLKLTSILLLSLLFLSSSLMAQNKRLIKGRVIDDKKQPLIGATVLVKGQKTLSTITDVDGQFSLSIPADNKQPLVVSFISYQTQEINITGKSFVTVTMNDNNVDLGDVVVVGYGSQKKASVVGAITQTKGEILERAGGVADIGSALTGTLPGVITVATTGSPGSETPKIYIRGASTWNNTDPLVLVDGIERAMNSVDISSVDNISVLKDASATAVYGVKGANGVILITTKRGKEGKSEIRVTVNTTVKMPSKLLTKYDSYDALDIRNNSIEKELGIDDGWAKYTPLQELNKYRNPANQTEALRYPNIDWQNTLVKNATIDNNASVNISGGTSFAKYFTSVDYLNQTDILKKIDNGKSYDPGYAYQRLNVRSNIDLNLTKTTVLSVNLAGSYGVKQDAYGQDSWEYRIWQSIYSVPPDVYYPKYSDGSWGYYPPNTVGTINSALVLGNNGIRKTTTKQINTDYTLKQDLGMILNGLSAKATLSYDNTFVTQGGVYDNGSVQQKYIDPVTGEVKYSNYLGTNQFDWIQNQWSVRTDATALGPYNNDLTYRKLFYQVQLNYARKFGLHDVTAMGVFSRENYATGAEYPYLREDWVGRATYNYATKYFVEVNAAYNGSERFSSKNRFAFFPSAALGWMVTEENFMKEIKFLDMLKIRGSVGQAGSDNLNGYGRWLYLSQWKYGNNASLSTTGGTSPYTQWSVASLGNENIHWEKVTKKNIGFDYSFLNGLFTGSADFFNDYRTDILLGSSSQAIPDYFGATAPAVNVGKVKSHGYELTIRLNKQLNKNFRVWGDFSMTHNENKIIDANDAQLLDSYQKQAGYMLNQNRSYVTAGYFNNWDQLYGSTKFTSNNSDKLPGSLNKVDFNGDGVIDQKDQIPYGYSEMPQNTYNTTLGFDWKAFTVMVQFYGVSNCNRYMEQTSFGQKLDNVYKQGSMWSINNTTADIPWARYNSVVDNSYSTLYLYDGSYLRLKNVEIAYTFKDQWVKSAGINSIRVYLNGDNLALWSKLPDDREVNEGNGTAYPTVRRVNLGLNITF